MKQLVNIHDFINYLKDNDLVIVGREFVEKQKPSINDLLSRRYLTFKQLADSGILPIKSKQSVENWIAKGKIKQDAVYVGNDGIKRIAITEIKRLNKIYGYE